MHIKENLQKAPLGWPLAIASVGTVATIFAGKKLHMAFGAAWGVLSLWHAWQHCRKMKHDLAKAQEFLRTGLAPEGRRPDACTLALARYASHRASCL